MPLNSDNKYTNMQLASYNNEATHWSIDTPDPVVGSFHAHNNWQDYELLFESIYDLETKIGLDFACGPGRNLVKYGKRFKRLDGIDISPINIEKAKHYTSMNNLNDILLFVSNGIDLDEIESDTYDVVMSTIALQHICVYDIRKNILSDIYRILKNGGVFTAQMGFGSPSPSTVGYYENFYDAKSTNRGCDVCVESPEQIQKDLESLGFKNFSFTITQTGPGDCHPNWIFFHASK